MTIVVWRVKQKSESRDKPGFRFYYYFLAAFFFTVFFTVFLAAFFLATFFFAAFFFAAIFVSFNVNLGIVRMRDLVRTTIA